MIIINIQQLTYFIKLSECRNFSLASYELCISQSSLSKHIKSLENELNAVLIDRNTRSIKLTSAGEKFLIYARRSVTDYNNTLSELKKYTEVYDTLNLGSIPVIAQYNITGAIASFKKLYPNIDINIIEDMSHNILDNMIKSNVNLGIIRDFNLSHDIFEKTHIQNDELVLIVSAQHPFAEKEEVNLLDIKDEKLILLGARSGIYERCTNEFRKHGIIPHISMTSYKIETILGLVKENLGVTLLMKKTLQFFCHDNIRIIPLSDPVSASLILINRKDLKLSDSENLFKNFIKEYFST